MAIGIPPAKRHRRTRLVRLCRHQDALRLEMELESELNISGKVVLRGDVTEGAAVEGRNRQSEVDLI